MHQSPFSNIPFIDLQAQRAKIAPQILESVQRVIEGGHYIMGPEVLQLEAELSKFAGVKYAIGCSNGTDALSMPLMALEIGPGDAIFVPTFTFAATAEVVALRGATPVFVDVNASTFNMDPISLERAIAHVTKEKKLVPKGIISVDLFGQPADLKTIGSIADKYGLWVMIDAAQSFGATLDSVHTVNFGLVASTSFFPAKPLGCYGDGGAIFTNNDDLKAKLTSIRVHGQGSDRYDNVRIGINGRLDTLQAAILIEKLKIFPAELDSRSRIAARYSTLLQDVVKVPYLAPNKTSAWAQYTLCLENRDHVAAFLKAKGIPTMVYYPKALHQQGAYRHYPQDPQGLSVAETLCQQVLSLPMHPYLEEDVQDYIVAAVREAVA